MPIPWNRAVPGLGSVLALVLATGCWSVPSDPGGNARCRASRAPAPPTAAEPLATTPARGQADPAAAGVYYTRCAQCHEAVSPGDYAAGEWPALVDRYGPRAGLYGAERQRVLGWLQANAR